MRLQGGSEMFADYCPVVNGYGNMACRFGDDDKGFTEAYGGLFSEASRCLETHLFGTGYKYQDVGYGCYPVRCVSNSQLAVTVAGTQLTCDRAGQTLKLAAFGGTFVCPDPAELCASASASAVTVTAAARMSAGAQRSAASGDGNDTAPVAPPDAPDNPSDSDGSSGLRMTCFGDVDCQAPSASCDAASNTCSCPPGYLAPSAEPGMCVMACQGNCNEANGQGQCTASGQCQCASGYSGYDCGSGDDSVLFGLSKAYVIGISCAIFAALVLAGFAVVRYRKMKRARATSVPMEVQDQNAVYHQLS